MLSLLEIEKKLRALRKKVVQIDQLKEKDSTCLDEQAKAKVASEEEIKKEIVQLEMLLKAVTQEKYEMIPRATEMPAAERTKAAASSKMASAPLETTGPAKAGTSPAAETLQSGPAAPTRLSPEQEKRIKALRKKLVQIEQLKLKDPSTLDEDAKRKVASEAELRSEIVALETCQGHACLNTCVQIGKDASKTSPDAKADPRVKVADELCRSTQQQLVGAVATPSKPHRATQEAAAEGELLAQELPLDERDGPLAEALPLDGRDGPLALELPVDGHQQAPMESSSRWTSTTRCPGCSDGPSCSDKLTMPKRRIAEWKVETDSVMDGPGCSDSLSFSETMPTKREPWKPQWRIAMEKAVANSTMDGPGCSDSLSSSEAMPTKREPWKPKWRIAMEKAKENSTNDGPGCADGLSSSEAMPTRREPWKPKSRTAMIAKEKAGAAANPATPAPMISVDSAPKISFDWHKTLTVGDNILHPDAVQAVEEAAEEVGKENVYLLSYCFENTETGVRRAIASTPRLADIFEGRLEFTRAKTGPGGKAERARKLGISVHVDDREDIVDEFNDQFHASLGLSGLHIGRRRGSFRTPLDAARHFVWKAKQQARRRLRNGA
jgi:hypothetical protein